jgi:hypothetical protein
MKLIKDLLYTKGNAALDIARLASLFSILAFWGGVFWLLYLKGTFSPTETGAGCAAIMAGAAGWIYARQKQEGAE